MLTDSLNTFSICDEDSLREEMKKEIGEKRKSVLAVENRSSDNFVSSYRGVPKSSNHYYRRS